MSMPKKDVWSSLKKVASQMKAKVTPQSAQATSKKTVVDPKVPLESTSQKTIVEQKGPVIMLPKGTLPFSCENALSNPIQPLLFTSKL